ncbi:hypothetical protein DXG03_004534 [Asterophora parasitica]|uniref:Uncharacterized protein n=1 Tax=Asterophora parasitica TaxID=117018 RepID=A0A9P7KA78_9AGAR|nr:hypothetical protein DXG03_004534 [Asterophora parasitica]
MPLEISTKPHPHANLITVHAIDASTSRQGYVRIRPETTVSDLQDATVRFIGEGLPGDAGSKVGPAGAVMMFGDKTGSSPFETAQPAHISVAHH